MKRAVVVFSGGQDSTTCLIQAKREKKYDEIYSSHLIMDNAIVRKLKLRKS